MGDNVVITSMEELSPVMEECLRNGAEVILTVTGNSMRPFLRHRRDQVVLTACDAGTLHVGDVPLYRRADGRFVLHRVVGVSASTYTMCGDAQAKKEYGVPTNRIVAVATGFYRRGKYVACSDPKYRLQMRLWLLVLPLRPLLLKTGSVTMRILRRVRSLFVKKG